MFKRWLELYNNSISISKHKDDTKFDFQCFRHKQGREVRITSFRKHLEYIPVEDPYYDVLSDMGLFWNVPVELPDGGIIGFLYKKYESKEYLIVSGRNMSMPPVFGLQCFGDFRFGSFVFLVEGFRDAVYVQRFYPYTISVLNSSMTVAMISFLKGMTNKVIIGLDNDEVGNRSSESLAKSLGTRGIGTVRMRPKMKDFGDYFKNIDRMDALFKKELNRIL